MKCPTPNSLMFSVLILINRVPLGLYFAFAGIGKIKGGINKFYQESFLGLKPEWLPEAFAQPYGYALPFLELVFGALLVLGIVGRVSAGVLFLMLVSFTVALMMKSGDLTGGGHGVFHYNVILATLALLLAVTGSGGISLDAIWCKSCRIKAH